MSEKTQLIDRQPTWIIFPILAASLAFTMIGYHLGKRAADRWWQARPPCEATMTFPEPVQPGDLVIVQHNITKVCPDDGSGKTCVDGWANPQEMKGNITEQCFLDNKGCVDGAVIGPGWHILLPDAKTGPLRQDQTIWEHEVQTHDTYPVPKGEGDSDKPIWVAHPYWDNREMPGFWQCPIGYEQVSENGITGASHYGEFSGGSEDYIHVPVCRIEKLRQDQLDSNKNLRFDRRP